MVLNFKVTALSPLHIGCGEEMDPLSYVIDDNNFLNVINLDNLLENVAEQIKVFSGSG